MVSARELMSTDRNLSHQGLYGFSLSLGVIRVFMQIYYRSDSSRLSARADRDPCRGGGGGGAVVFSLSYLIKVVN